MREKLGKFGMVGGITCFALTSTVMLLFIVSSFANWAYTLFYRLTVITPAISALVALNFVISLLMIALSSFGYGRYRTTGLAYSLVNCAFDSFIALPVCMGMLGVGVHLIGWR